MFCKFKRRQIVGFRNPMTALTWNLQVSFWSMTFSSFKSIWSPFRLVKVALLQTNQGWYNCGFKKTYMNLLEIVFGCFDIIHDIFKRLHIVICTENGTHCKKWPLKVVIGWSCKRCVFCFQTKYQLDYPPSQNHPKANNYQISKLEFHGLFVKTIQLSLDKLEGRNDRQWT